MFRSNPVVRPAWRRRLALVFCLFPLQLAIAAEEPSAEDEPPTASESSAPKEMNEVEACVRANAPRETMVQEATITTLDSTGADRVQEGKFYWKRDKKGLSRIYLRVEAPPELRGAAFLMIERSDRPDDMWMYLPELDKVRRISSRTISGSLFGTDFSYEDIQHLQLGFQETIGQRLPDSELDGRPVYVVELQPSPEMGSGYSRIVTHVDREYCVPLKVEFFEDSDRLRKLMTLDPNKVVKAANTWVPRDIVLRDLDRETESRFVVGDVEVDAKLSDRRFTQSQLAKGR